MVLLSADLSSTSTLPRWSRAARIWKRSIWYVSLIPEKKKKKEPLLVSSLVTTNRFSVALHLAQPCKYLGVFPYYPNSPNNEKAFLVLHISLASSTPSMTGLPPWLVQWKSSALPADRNHTQQQQTSSICHRFPMNQSFKHVYGACNELAWQPDLGSGFYYVWDAFH